MIRRIRELMALPFAAPPQARRRAWRLMPEAAAAGVYAVLGGAALVLRLQGGPGRFLEAAGWAYLAASLAAVLLPAGTAALALSAEREGGTLEALTLLPVARGELTWGRYLHLVTPWLRFFAWLLPLYVLCAPRMSWPIAGHGEPEVRLALWSFAPGPVLAGFLVLGSPGPAQALPGGAVYALALRLATDMLGVCLAAAAGLFVSARLKASAVALAVGPAAALVLVLGLAGGPTWAALAVGLMTGVGGEGRLAVLHVVWTVLAVLAEVLVIRGMVMAAARGLDSSGQDEPGRPQERPGN